MSFSLIYSNRALSEDIPFLASAVAARIKTAIERKLVSDPIRFGKPLSHAWKGHRSLRVGDYRVLYRVDMPKKTVFIVTVGHRREIYDQ